MKENPIGQRHEANKPENAPHSPIPISVAVTALKSMNYEVEEIQPFYVSARCETSMPNLHVLTTPLGIDVRSWWSNQAQVDRETLMEAINQANSHARTWRYSLDSDGDILVDRAIIFTGSDVTADRLAQIFTEGNIEMLMTITIFLRDVLG